MMSRCKIALIYILLMLAKVAFAAPLTTDLGIETAYDNNLSATPEMMGEGVSGMHVLAQASARKTYVLSEDFSFMAKLGASYHAYDIDDSADYASLDVVFSSIWKPFDGYKAPVVRASILARGKNYRNDFSNDHYVNAKLSLNAFLSDAISTQIGISYREGWDEWAQVDTINKGYWDTQREGVFAGMDIRFDDFILYTSVSYTDGDLIWTRPMNGGFYSGIWTDAEQIDLDLGINIPVSAYSALDLLGSYSEVRRGGSKMFDNSSVSAAYIHRLSF